MTKREFPILLLLVLVATCEETTDPTPRPPNPQHVSVLTQHNDNTRAGLNDNETLLTTSNVNVQQFGQVFSVAVDDEVYAQPLVVGSLAIGGGTHNVVYAATVNNTVYAFDGDDGRIFWQKNYTIGGQRAPRNTDMVGACGGQYQDFSGNIGIVGSPVIDASTQTMYFVARSTTGSAFSQHLHAVDIVTGNEKAGSPIALAATYAGTGAGSSNGSIAFDARRQNQRQALTLLNGTVYISFSSHCDWGPYHGWILGYEAATLQQNVVYNVTPDGSAAGMWESGMGMAADADGNLYVVTGNGTVGVGGDPTNVRNRGESALKLTRTGATLQVASWFTPNNYPTLDQFDLDYGSMGGFLIPNSDYYLTGAKDGNVYLLNADDMGGHATPNRAHQTVTLGNNANMRAQAAYYKGSAKEFVYLWSENTALHAFPFDRGSNRLDVNAVIRHTQGGPLGQSGAVLSTSSNGTQDGTGILWASYAFIGDANHTVSPGILRAFSAADVTRELWNNRQNFTRDYAGAYAKFSSPTIANGHVYLATFSNRVVAYGLQ
jgi:hypothetical protein